MNGESRGQTYTLGAGMGVRENVLLTGAWWERLSCLLHHKPSIGQKGKESAGEGGGRTWSSQGLPIRDTLNQKGDPVTFLKLHQHLPEKA